ncbi:MAG: translation initiation factor IF-2 [Planctomycetaceae bacterium]
MKIRIFALAKELDIDSKLLIDYCAKAGIVIKNSALASISPDEKDRVMDVIRSSAPVAVSAEAKPAAPSRELAPEMAGKVRTMRTMMSRPQPGRGRPVEPEAPAETIAPEVEAAEEPIIPEAEPAVPEVAVPDEVAPPLVAEAPSAPADPAPPTESPGAAPTRPGPLGPGDYIPIGSNKRPMRNVQMTSRGTSDTSITRDSKKGKPRSGGPMIAAIPNFKAPPSAKPDEEKTQKPEITFTRDSLQKDSPLLGHLRKSTEGKGKKRGGDDDVAEPGVELPAKGKGDRAGLGLEGTRKRRTSSRRDVAKQGEEDEEGAQRTKAFPRGAARRGRGGATPLKSKAEIELPITIRSLSEALGRPAKSIMQILWNRGDKLTINAELTEDLAMELAMELGVDLQILREKDLEEELLEVENYPDEEALLLPRPPIVTILGHVDHGKTTLVDKIRSANVAATEFGGITQHIAAYQVRHNDKKLTFVDTPGHAAFGEMRARGANVTDIVVLVVAANDGVMPQTVECISHARAANVPIVVALNKVDLPDRNEQRVLQDLAAHNILASEWGGDIEVVRTSGLTGQGVPDLLDTLLLTAELHEFRSNPQRAASGICLESFRDEGRGAIAWMIVRKGTLHVGDVVVCGQAYGRIRALYDERDQEILEAGPSTPVKVAGLDLVPGAGDRFLVLDDLDTAREIAETRRQKGRADSLSSRGGRRTLEEILQAARDGEIQDLYLIVKADTPGSLEALKSEIGKFSHPEVRVKILHEGVGGVNESDVYLASASKAVIVAFHVVAEDKAEQLAQQEEVDIRRYNIIYEVTDDIRSSLEGMLRPEIKEVITGRAIVLRLFNISRFGTIAGCRVLNGTIERTHRIHLIRDQKVMNSYGIGSLRREKDDAREVREGMECGIRLEGFNDIKEGDLLEAYRVEEVKRTLD